MENHSIQITMRYTCVYELVKSLFIGSFHINTSPFKIATKEGTLQVIENEKRNGKSF
jgi:hypothetical protein